MNDKTKNETAGAVSKPCHWQVTFKYINKNALLRSGVAVVVATTEKEAKEIAASNLANSEFSFPRIINARIY